MLRNLLIRGYSLWHPEVKSVTKSRLEKVRKELLSNLTSESFKESTIKFYGDEKPVARLVRQLRKAESPAKLMIAIKSPFNQAAMKHTSIYYPDLVPLEIHSAHVTWKTVEDAVDKAIKRREPSFSCKSMIG